MFWTTKKATDWECVGVATVGAAGGVAAAIQCFEFRSAEAKFRGAYLFTGVGVGLGGNLGGGIMPSPADIVTNTKPDLWTPLRCVQAFSADDLDMAPGTYATISAGLALSYSLTSITAKTIVNGNAVLIFGPTDVSGWSVGSGLNATAQVGMWTRVGGGKYY